MSVEPAAHRVLNRRRFTAEEVHRPPGDSAASRALFAWYAPGFSDRLGDRLNLFDNTDGPPLELLRLRAELSRAADFEFSLRARVSELADFQHPRFARVFRADRLPEPGGGLALVSARTDGLRLSDVLRLADQRAVRLSANLLLPLVADATDAVAALHARGPHVAHLALCADRLIVAPGGRLQVAEYVLGSALRGLRYSRAEMWRLLRVALPSGAAPNLDQRVDVFQLGLVGLSLALARPLDDDEDLDRIRGLLGEADRRVPGAGWNGLWPAFREWLCRALQLDARTFTDAWDAGAALAEAVPLDVRRPSPMQGAAAWDQFVSDCEAPPILTGRDKGSRPALSAGGGPGGAQPVQPTRNPAPVTGLDDWERPSTPPSAESESLPAGRPEEVHGPPLPPSPPRRPLRRETTRAPRLVTPAVVAALAIATMGGGVAIGARFFAPGRQAADSSVHVDSSPQGALVTVDGAPAGRTPVTLSLSPGSHLLELVAGSSRRTVPVSLAKGARLSHFVEMPAASTSGELRVTTDPQGLRVIVDGKLRGTSPLLVSDLAPGPHVVAVEGRGRSARHEVKVDAGATAALFVPLSSGGAPSSGWLSIAGEIELQVYENGELVGTSRSPRIMLPAGLHEVELVNEELGVRIGEEVRISPGGTSSLEVDLPQGRMDVNALPWAEVWLDGKRIGETPLGGVPARVGRHMLTFRHPQLGERRVECLVAAGRPTRVGVDLRK
ncbi:MAG TPA: PEGA domain-containing protein [Vicinamibacterales bacterium]|nr:PEGA domain-containing protein [Vicinamibacterales bacterium]